MAYPDLIAALRLPAHPMARSGYGKRSVPAQEPYQQQDFAHLPMREGCIAAYIDRLPEGSAIDTKTLARELPLYGQQAVRSALRNLSEAGHLRRVRETTQGTTGTRHWVQRTYFSAEVRDDAWWTAYLANGTAEPPVEAPATEPEPELEPELEPEAVAPVASAPKPAASAAYQALAGLAGVEPRLTLSAAECSALEGLAAEWFARGASIQQFIVTLTAGLPQVVHSAGALTRNRLIQKMPPELPWLPKPETQLPPRELTMECTDCGRPGRSTALPGGICADCRNDTSSAQSAHARPLADELRSRVAGLRNALRAGVVPAAP